MSALTCIAARRLPGPAQMPVLHRHSDACLRCQADAARARRLQRELRALRSVVEPAPQGLLATVMSTLDGAVEPAEPMRRRGVLRRTATGGALLAAAVGAAVVAVRRGHLVG